MRAEQLNAGIDLVATRKNLLNISREMQISILTGSNIDIESAPICVERPQGGNSQGSGIPRCMGGRWMGGDELNATALLSIFAGRLFCTSRNLLGLPSSRHLLDADPSYIRRATRRDPVNTRPKLERRCDRLVNNMRDDVGVSHLHCCIRTVDLGMDVVMGWMTWVQETIY